MRRFLIKLFHWEYWPTSVVYFPVKIYAVWLGIKAKSFTFFTLTNPLIETGGFFGASKARQLAFLPSELKPVTLLFTHPSNLSDVKSSIASHHITFPCIAKPDRAERGVGVSLLKSDQDLEAYHSKTKCDYIIQSYIPYDFEAGVFYTKKPGASSGEIPSIVLKEFLTLKGDGQKTYLELLSENDRAYLVIDKVRARIGDDINKVITKDAVILVEPIGNHNRGTKFIDGKQYISPALVKVFDEIAAHIPEFYYGRFDLRAPSLDDLLKGKDIKILEINGVNAEPAHIYDPAFPLFKGIATLMKHWQLIYEIALLNRNRGFEPATIGEIKKYWQLRKENITT